ncbi:glycosyltransferase family 2 protein [Geobacillus thermodenitrificans]|uniref:glycosyltransferase family 2 protein n=1 Tax=Geobacillus thermodenitrificans TaxID=33940 RepID=UPI0015E7FDEB|nr:glycosyltransferase family 2 protein [Geobacillus thermodenitrificans]
MAGKMVSYKVTVGIPVYNDGEYIERCLRSIVDQTMDFSHIEIICVDDGSTDETADIIKKFQQQYGRYNNIHYYFHENTGNPSRSRNKVIDEAKGEYIYFVDGDDYLGSEALERMYRQGKENEAEIVIGKYKGVNRGVPVVMFQEKKERTTFFDSKAVDSMNVLKMFKTAFLRRYNIRFHPNIFHAEDHPFTMKAYLHAKVISIVNDYDCYYCTRYTDGNRVQLTRRLIPVDEFYAYFFETLNVIKEAELSEELKNKAAYMYWRRLLLLDIPNEFKRPRPVHDRVYSFHVVQSIAHQYMTPEIYAHFTGKEKLTLTIILDGTYRIFDEFMKQMKR